jgi:hypothetical protein
MAIRTITAPIAELADFHPGLIWDDIIAATAFVWKDIASLRTMLVTGETVPGFGSGEVRLRPSLSGIAEQKLANISRTYEASRLVEYASIGIAGLALHYLGSHEIRDVTARGSGADYLMDAECHLLEIAGRSRKADFAQAWSSRRMRLSRQWRSFVLFVVEFETPAACLEFIEG